jgi:sRNA-binding carbon storage regulator CsrA
MQKVLLSAISAIAGGTIVHITDKEIIDGLKSENQKLLDRIEKLKYELIKKERRLNECIKALDELPVQEVDIKNNEIKVTINTIPENIKIKGEEDDEDEEENIPTININGSNTLELVEENPTMSNSDSFEKLD